VEVAVWRAEKKFFSRDEEANMTLNMKVVWKTSP